MGNVAFATNQNKKVCWSTNITKIVMKNKANNILKHTKITMKTENTKIKD